MARLRAEHELTAIQRSHERQEAELTALRERNGKACTRRDDLEMQVLQLENSQQEVTSQLERRLAALVAHNEVLTTAQKKEGERVLQLMELTEQYRLEDEEHKLTTSRLEAQLQQSQQQLEVLHRAMQAAHAAHREEVKGFQESVQSSASREHELQLQVKRQEEELRSAAAANDDAARSLTRLQSTVEKMHAEGEEERVEWKRKAAALEERCEAKEKELREQTTAVRTHLDALQTLRRVSEEKASERQALDGDHAVLKVQVSELRRQLEAMRSQSAQVREEGFANTMRLQQAISSLEENLLLAEQQRVTAEDRLHRCSTQHQLAASTSHQEADQLRAALREVEGVLKGQVEQHLVSQDEVAKLKRQLESTQQELTQWKGAYSTEHSQLEAVQRTCEAQSLSLQELKQEQIFQHRAALTAAAADRAALQNRMDEALQTERAAAAEARTARDTALDLLQQQQQHSDSSQRPSPRPGAELSGAEETMAASLGAAEEEELKELRSYAAAVEQVIADAASELGMQQQQNEDGSESRLGATDVVHALLDVVHLLSHAGATLGAEDAELEGLRGLLERQQQAATALCEAAATVSSPLPHGHSVVLAAVESASLTFLRRCDDHIREMERSLQQLTVSIAAGLSSSTEASCAANSTTPPVVWTHHHRAAVALQRTEIKASIGVLHRHATRMWRAMLAAMPSAASPGSSLPPSEQPGGGVSPRPRPPMRFSLSALESCRLHCERGEAIALQPFHSLVVADTMEEAAGPMASYGGARTSLPLFFEPSLRAPTVNQFTYGGSDAAYSRTPLHRQEYASSQTPTPRA